MSETLTEGRHWTFTIVRAYGFQQLRTEKSWRPIVTITVDDHKCHELSLGCDGQNPNLKDCFQLDGIDASSQIDICVYHLAQSKKKNKRRNLVASARCTLQELARLQAQQECRQRSVEIKLNCVSRPKGGVNKARSSAVTLVAKFKFPEVCKAQPICLEEDVGSSLLGEESGDESMVPFLESRRLPNCITVECSSTPTSDCDEDPGLPWPKIHHPEPKVYKGYWSDSDRILSEDEQDPLLKDQDNKPIIVPQLLDREDDVRVKHERHKLWFAASVLPAYTEAISITTRVSTVDSVVDSFTPYRELREAQLDSEYERVLTELCAEWRFVGGSLVALAGLEAGVFGFSSASAFTISKFATRAIAVASVASGIGLTIDAWFLLAYCNITSTKFQKMAMDVYGTYLFFCISARIPALCMFTSACALMAFMLSVAWSAWPNAVLVMSFVAGVLVSLQFIVYGLHCVVVFIADVIRHTRKGILRCLAWIRPPPPDVREKPAVQH